MSLDSIPELSDGLAPIQRHILNTLAQKTGSVHQRTIRSSQLLESMLGGTIPFLEELLQPEEETAKTVLGSRTNPYLAAYLELTHLVQPFRTRYPLKIGTGNFGSIDADPPVDPVFTECSLSNFGAAVIKGTLPHLLVNGSSGCLDECMIHFLPHNLSEILEAASALIRDPRLSDEELLSFVPGPDFPTGGEILTTPAAVQRIYREGEGTLLVGCKAKIETAGSKAAIVVTEIPFCTSKSGLVSEISESIGTGELKAIFDVLDESNENGMRLVFLVLPSVDPHRCHEALLSRTGLTTTLQVEMSGMVDGVVQRVSLPALLKAYVRQLADSVSRSGGEASPQVMLAELEALGKSLGDARRTMLE